MNSLDMHPAGNRPAAHLLAAVLCLILAHPPAATAAAPGSASETERCSPIRGLVILTRFPDVSHTVRRSFVKRRFFHDLDQYVRQVSYGKYCIAGEITRKTYELPHPIARYRISDRNLEVDPRRMAGLIVHTINMAGNDVELADYDFIAILMEATAAEYGMIGLCGYPSHGSKYNEGINRLTGFRIRPDSGVAVFSYQAPLGTIFHDIAHILAGRDGDGNRRLPHLYDNDLQALPGPMMEVFRKSQVNAGYWDPLSCHHVERGRPPPGPLSWTRLKLGWLEHEKVREVQPGDTARITLDPLEDGSGETLAIRIPISRDTYYLIENRQPIGVDKYLPGHGVLIMFADDRVHRAVDGKAPAKLVNADPDIPDLNGAAFDIGKNESYVDVRNGIRIRLLRKIERSYEVEISPYGE